jgi:excisionase family DNA binding protein
MQVTLSEAAVRLKMSERTVRRWLHSGKLQGSQLPTDRGFQWLVDIPDDLLEPPKEEPPEEPSGELEALRELNSILKDRLEAADRELEARRREVQELHVLLQQAHAALPAQVDTRRRWWRFWQWS